MNLIESLKGKKNLKHLKPRKIDNSLFLYIFYTYSLILLYFKISTDNNNFLHKNCRKMKNKTETVHCRSCWKFYYIYKVGWGHGLCGMGTNATGARLAPKTCSNLHRLQSRVHFWPRSKATSQEQYINAECPLFTIKSIQQGEFWS